MSYEATKTDLLLASAFCEEIYRRDPREQSLGTNNAQGEYEDTGFKSFYEDQFSVETDFVEGFTSEKGYYYNDSTGFVGNYGDSASN
jgi:hypothetical protein